MISSCLLKEDFSSFISSFQTKQILLVELGFSHGENLVTIGSVIHGAPMLIFIGVHHAVLCSLHHGKLVGFPEIGLVLRLEFIRIFIVEICQLGVLKIAS